MKRIFYIIRDISKRISRKNLNAYAASTAFFLFISLIPMLIMVCAVLPYTPLTEGDLMLAVREFMPSAMHPLMIGIISDVYDSTAGIVSTAALFTFWSAGKGVLALMRGLNAINGVEENHSFLVSRLIASIYTLIMLAVLILSLLIMVFGNSMIRLLIRNLPRLDTVVSFLLHFRYFILWAAFSIGLALIYVYIPGVRTKLRMQLPGAALAAWSWLLISFGFSVYVDYFNGFSMYRSLTTIVMIMIWLYTGVYVIMLGSYMNKYFRPLYTYLARRKLLRGKMRKRNGRTEK